MHKISFSQQLEAVEELVQERGGREGQGIFNIWAADSFVRVHLRESWKRGSGSHWRLKCNEVRLKGAPVTGKHAEPQQGVCGDKRRRNARAFGVVFGISGLFAQAEESTQRCAHLNTKAPWNTHIL